jgi:hypothetical protein
MIDTVIDNGITAPQPHIRRLIWLKTGKTGLAHVVLLRRDACGEIGRYRSGERYRNHRRLSAYLSVLSVLRLSRFMLGSCCIESGAGTVIAKGGRLVSSACLCCACARSFGAAALRRAASTSAAFNCASHCSFAISAFSASSSALRRSTSSRCSTAASAHGSV